MDNQVKPVKYLVCVNDTEHSRIAVKFAYKRARKRGSKIDLLHVVEPTDFQSLFAIGETMRDARREEAGAFLEGLAAMVHEASGVTPSLIIKEGAVEEAIIQAIAEDPDIDMLVVGASTKANKRHAHINALVKALGDKLLIPLVIVPGNLTDQQIEELA